MQILLLHIANPRFTADDARDPDALAERVLRTRSLGAEVGVGLVLVSGSVTSSAKPEEFERAEQYLRRLAHRLGLPHGRVHTSPGPDDISLEACRVVEADPVNQGIRLRKLRRRMFTAQIADYRSFVGRLTAHGTRHTLALGGELRTFPGLRAHVVSHNSTPWLSHRAAERGELPSDTQVGSTCAALRRADQTFIKVMVAHRGVERSEQVPDPTAWLPILDLQLYLHADLSLADVPDQRWEDGAGHLIQLATGDSPRLVLLDSLKRELRTTLISEEGAPVETRRFWLPTGFTHGFVPPKGQVAADVAALVAQIRGRVRAPWRPDPGGRPPGPDEDVRGLAAAQRTLLRGRLTWPRGPRQEVHTRSLVYLNAHVSVYDPSLPNEAWLSTWVLATVAALEHEPDALPLRLTVHDLRRVSDRGTLRTVLSLLQEQVDEQYGPGHGRALSRALSLPSGPRPVLLVDGRLGQEPEERAIRERLLDFAARHPRLLLITTFSMADCPSMTLGRDQGFDRLELEPLDDARIQQLAVRFWSVWLDESRVKAAQHELEALLASGPEVRALLSAPRWLVRAVGLALRGPLPRSFPELAEALVEQALDDAPPDDTSLSREVRRAALYRLCWELQRTRNPNLTNKASSFESVHLSNALPPDWTTAQKLAFATWVHETIGLTLRGSGRRSWRDDDPLDSSFLALALDLIEVLAARHLFESLGPEAVAALVVERARVLHDVIVLRRLTALLSEQHGPLVDRLMATLLAGAGPPMALALLERDAPIERLAAATVALAERRCSRDGTLTSEVTDPVLQARRAELILALHDRLRFGSLGERLRLNAIFRHRADEPGLPPSERPLVSLAMSASAQAAPADLRQLAAARVLNAARPCWPGEPEGLGLLQLWPGPRSTLGLRLQAALAMGAPAEALPTLARALHRAQEVDPRALPALIARFSKNAHLVVYGNFEPTYRVNFIQRFPADYAREVLASVAGSQPEEELALADALWREHAMTLSYQVFPVVMGTGDADRVPANARRRSSRTNSHMGAWPPLYLLTNDAVGQHPTLPVAEMLAQRARPVALALGLHETPRWLDHLVRYELILPIGLALPRVLVAGLATPRTPQQALMAAACRASYGAEPAELERALQEHGASLHPLWPALARHLARRSTAEDRALLEDLAQHPERAPEHLSWGLRLVRGDVLLEDGRFVPLDGLLEGLPWLTELPA